MFILLVIVGIVVLFVALPLLLAFICGIYDGLKDSTTFKKYLGGDDE